MHILGAPDVPTRPLLISLGRRPGFHTQRLGTGVNSVPAKQPAKVSGTPLWPAAVEDPSHSEEEPRPLYRQAARDQGRETAQAHCRESENATLDGCPVEHSRIDFQGTSESFGF